MTRIVSVCLVTVLLAFWNSPSIAALPPKTVGTCADSFVQSKRFRMLPSPGDPGYARTSNDVGKEVFILLANGIGIYSGEGDDFIQPSNFAAGHKVKLCLESLPRNCPK